MKKITRTLLSVSLFALLASCSSFKASDEDTLTYQVKLNEKRLQHDLAAFKRETDCLAENIVMEASNQSLKGKIAVAQVTMNRVRSGKFRKTICGVVKQPYQFSWVLQKKRQKYDTIQFNEARMIAINVIQNKVQIPELKDSLYYHADYVSPIWKKKMIRVAKIDNHIFYRKEVTHDI